MTNDKNYTHRSIITAEQKEKNLITSQVSYFGFTTTTEVIYPYGMKAHPVPGNLSITYSLQGNADNHISIPYAVNKDSKLPKTTPGDVIIGSPTSGSNITFKSNGDIIIKGNMTITGDFKLKGKMNVDGDIETSGKITASGIIKSNSDVETATVKLKSHIHSGVTTGGGTSGQPVP